MCRVQLVSISSFREKRRENREEAKKENNFAFAIGFEEHSDFVRYLR